MQPLFVQQQQLYHSISPPTSTYHAYEQSTFPGFSPGPQSSRIGVSYGPSSPQIALQYAVDTRQISRPSKETASSIANPDAESLAKPFGAEAALQRMSVTLMTLQDRLATLEGSSHLRTASTATILNVLQLAYFRIAVFLRLRSPSTHVNAERFNLRKLFVTLLKSFVKSSARIAVDLAAIVVIATVLVRMKGDPGGVKLYLWQVIRKAAVQGRSGNKIET